MPQLTLEFALFVGFFAALFWRLAERFRPPALAVASTCFLWAWDPVSCLFLMATTAAAFAGARLAKARSWVWRGGLVAIVIVFATVKTCEVAGGGFESFAVPLGFGFYIPKLIHYWVDSDLEEPGEHGFLTFYNFMFFFPTILVGPIHRFEDFQSGERRRRWDPELLAEGLRRILHGYFKVVVVANWAVSYLMRGYLFELAAPGTRAWVLAECTTYGLYLYFAFSGYSDVAIGTGRLFGQVVGENFRRPFLQRNISEFWRCWHISLSDWCRRYVFVPTAASWRNPTLAVLATMVAIGLWHEFTGRYLLWGMYHGAGIAVHRAFAARAGPLLAQSRSRAVRAAGAAGATALTFTFVMVGFAITKNTSLAGTAEDFRILLFGDTP